MAERNGCTLKRGRTVKITVITAVISFFAGGTLMWAADNIFFIGTNKTLWSKLRTISSIADNYYLHDYDREAYADGAAKGAVAALGDPYTVYYNKQEYKDFTDSMNGDFVGIGAYVQNDTENDEIVIAEPMKGGAAEEAGLLPGDVIYAIDGKHYTGTQLDEAIAAMRGSADGSPEGVELTVTIKRGDTMTDYKLTRKRIHSDTVSSKMLDGGIGYIKIDSFNTGMDGEKNTFEEFSEHLDTLQSQNMSRLIIDLRNNGGGDADIVSKIADIIVPEGTIMYTEDKYGKREYKKSDESELNIPIALLVNENSASASELLAGALKDYGKAKLVGTTTYGKGVVQTVIPFSDGSGMKVTVSSYFTPNGYCVQDKGITPDYETELPEELKKKPVSDLTYEEDVQLQKAIEILSE